jgi:hypothetical protein
MTTPRKSVHTVAAMIRTRILVTFLVIFATMTAAGAASAATFTVTTTADVVDTNVGDGLCDTDAVTAGEQCTLRAAVQEANAGSTADTIDLPAGTYKIDKRTCGAARCDEEQAAEDDLDVKFPVTINGAGARSTVIDAGSNEAGGGAPATLQGIFEVVFGEPATFAVSGVTLTGGDASGAAVNSYGASVELTRVAVEGNDGNGESSVTATMGAPDTHLTITDSTIGPNAGKGVRTIAMPSVAIVNSTISGNSYQGYESAFDPAVAITASTISGNGQAGLDFEGAKTVPNGGSAVTLRNSIVAGNATVSDSVAHDCSAAPLTTGVNLDGDGTCGASKTGAPQLGALADNGGQTDTLLPAPTSPAVDAGADCAALSADQRGSARPKGSACDLGAVERDPVQPTGGDQGNGNGGGSGDQSGSGDQGGPGPQPSIDPPASSGTPPKGRALGFYCAGESKKRVKGLKGTPFSRCVTAMSKLDTKKAKTPVAACKGLPKKKAKGMKKSPYAVCVSGGTQLLADRKRSAGSRP